MPALYIYNATLCYMVSIAGCIVKGGANGGRAFLGIRMRRMRTYFLPSKRTF